MPTEGTVPSMPGLGSGHGQAGSGGMWPRTLCLWLLSPARDTCAWHQKTGRGPTSDSQSFCLGGKCLSPVPWVQLSLKPLVVTGALGVLKSISTCAWQRPSSSEGMEQFGFSTFLDCCLENCSALSSLAFPLPSFWDGAQILQ